MKYVIIGNGPAAIGAVEGIRKTDAAGEITLLSKEPHHTYSRPLISYLLLGKTDEEKMKYRPDGFYKENSVSFMPGVGAVSLDTENKTVKTEQGGIKYDRLLIAAGSRPFIPPMKGFETVENKFSFMTLDDAKSLRDALTPDSRVLIIGAGLIGLKCAEGIAGLCKSITVVDLADRILSSILDRDAAAIVEAHLREHGLSFHLSDSVEEFEGGTARLKSGEKIPFDVLVTAVGVKANISLASDAGGECGRGIKVNEKMETSLAHVYAAGDCAEGTDSVTGQSRILALMPNAYIQGECAGRNMAGGDAVCDSAMAQNAIGFFGLHMVTAGAYEGDVYESRGENEYKKLFYKDDRLMGYIIIGDIRRAGIYTAMIRDKTPLSGIDFEMICKNPSLMPFGRKRRAEMLGGVKA